MMYVCRIFLWVLLWVLLLKFWCSWYELRISTLKLYRFNILVKIEHILNFGFPRIWFNILVKTEHILNFGFPRIWSMVIDEIVGVFPGSIVCSCWMDDGHKNGSWFQPPRNGFSCNLNRPNCIHFAGTITHRSSQTQHQDSRNLSMFSWFKTY